MTNRASADANKNTSSLLSTPSLHRSNDQPSSAVDTTKVRASAQQFVLASARQFIFDAIKQAGIRTEPGQLIARNGGYLNWLIDLRPLFLRRDIVATIAMHFWERYRDFGPLQVGAVETAGIPLLMAILMTPPPGRGQINGFIVRKERKTTGRGQLIEGVVTEDPIVFVDDIINSGTSAEIGRGALAAIGRTMSTLFTVIDYESRRGNAWRQEHHVPVHALFKLSDFGLSLSPEKLPPPQRYKQLWHRDIPGGFAYHVVPKSAPVLVGDVIYRGCDSGRMQAFAVEDGALLWEHRASGAASRKGVWSTPAVHDGCLYYGAYNGVVYALDAKTCREIWAQPICEWVGASPLLVPEHGLLYVGLEYERPWAQGTLTALDMKTGAKAWELLVKKFQHGSAAYFRRDDLVIWGSADHDMLGLKAKTGEMVWSFPTRRSVKYAPAIDEVRGLVAFASFDKSIYLLDAATGKKLGEWETGDICYTTPLFTGDKLFCGSGDRHLYVIDLETRQIVKKLDLGARVYASPRRIGGRVIVGTSGGHIVEIDAESLEIEGRFKVPDAVTNAVAISAEEKRIFVSTYMNHLYAFERL